MCDTILATPDATAERTMLFGKNSDRYRNEAQTVECFPRAHHAAGTQLRCTYITIPQAEHTHAVLVCRPFWTWGAEMGANEHGVVIGNEGLRARSPAPTEEALIGMDLLRLALERASTAQEAVSVLTALLQHYGQGGNCGHLQPSYYNNGFMIADAADAFVLETIDREWVLERVRDVRAISNVYSIGHKPEQVSSGLYRLLQESEWTNDPSPDYAAAIADPQSQHIGDSAARRARSTALMQSQRGTLTAEHMINILRDHGTGDRTPLDWHPQRERRRTLCLHAGADTMPAQTTGSLMSEILRNDSVHWVTGTAAPCISIFKPVLLDVPLPAHCTRPTDRFDPGTLWWRHESLHRATILSDFGRFLNEIRAERDALEADFRARVNGVIKGCSVAERAQVVADCWEEAIEMEEGWFARIGSKSFSETTSYVSAWEEMNRIAGVDPIVLR